MSYRIELTARAQEDVQRLRSFDQRRVVQEIRSQLTESPDVETRNRKQLRNDVKANFRYTPPLWQLRIGEYRAFYEVDSEAAAVIVHAVRRKPPHRTTEEVLNETDRH